MNPIKIGTDRYVFIGAHGEIRQTSDSNASLGDSRGALTAKELDQLVARVEWHARQAAAPAFPAEIRCGESIHPDSTGVNCAGYRVPLHTLKVLQAASHRVLQNKKRKTKTHK